MKRITRRLAFFATLASALVLPVSVLVAQSISGAPTAQQLLGQRPSSTASLLPKAAGTAAVAGGAARPSETPSDLVRLKLAPGFLVALNVLDDPDFTGEFRVSQQGVLDLPILGPVPVDGLTVPEAHDRLQQLLLQRNILLRPQVNLSVLEYVAPHVVLEGEVATPGTYPLLAPKKLVDVLAMAGGLTVLAGKQVLIAHENSSRPVSVAYSRATDPAAVDGILIQPGDTVQVKRAGIVYVLGSVSKPGGYVMQEDGDLSVMQAISLAYGTTPAASDRVVILHRDAQGVSTQTQVSYKQMRHDPRLIPQVSAADVLFVVPSAWKTALTANSTLISTAASATVYGALR